VQVRSRGRFVGPSRRLRVLSPEPEPEAEAAWRPPTVSLRSRPAVAVRSPAPGRARGAKPSGSRQVSAQPTSESGTDPGWAARRRGPEALRRPRAIRPARRPCRCVRAARRQAPRPSPTVDHAAAAELSQWPRAPLARRSDCAKRYFVLPTSSIAGQVSTAGRSDAAGGRCSAFHPVEYATYPLPWLRDWSVAERLPDRSCAAFLSFWKRPPQLPGLDFRSGAHSFSAPSWRLAANAAAAWLLVSS
jgi:hypothetical protein